MQNVQLTGLELKKGQILISFDGFSGWVLFEDGSVQQYYKSELAEIFGDDVLPKVEAWIAKHPVIKLRK